MHEYRAHRKVEFSDTDAGGIVHFSRFFVFMEWAEHEFLRSLGMSPGFFVDGAGRRASWPRVAASCEYRAPARFGDDLDIVLRVLSKGRVTLTYAFEIHRDPPMANGDSLLAEGQITVAYCMVDAEGGLKAVPIPPEVAGLIDEAPTAPS
jgi:YbgC/YbaW family acyl-CoA thioester hydrolase